MSLESKCRKWYAAGRSHNFKTGRPIKNGGPTFRKLEAECAKAGVTSASPSPPKRVSPPKKDSSPKKASVTHSQRHELLVEWFNSDRTRNPDSGRPIAKGKGVYNRLMKEYEKVAALKPKTVETTPRAGAGGSPPKAKTPKAKTPKAKTPKARTPQPSHATAVSGVSASEAAAFHLPPRFTVTKVIASGGGGKTAFVIDHADNDNTYVAKVIHSSSKDLFNKELMWSDKAHKLGIGPEIVYRDARHGVFVMEAMKETLCDAFARQGNTLTPHQHKELYDLLKTAYDNDIDHNDLKCLNVMLDASGKMKLIDFGLARKVSAKNYKTVGDYITAGFGKVARSTKMQMGMPHMTDLDDYLETVHGWLTTDRKATRKREAQVAAFRAKRAAAKKK